MSSVEMSAEDKFALVGMSAANELFAHPFELGVLATAANGLTGKWKTLWDFRASQGVIYRDVLDAFNEAVQSGMTNQPVVLATPENKDLVRSSLPRNTFKLVVMRQTHLRSAALDLEMFEEMAWNLDYPRLLDPYDSQQESALDLGIISDREDHAAATEALQDEIRWRAELEMFEKDQMLAEMVDAERSRSLNDFLSVIASNSLLTELVIHVEKDSICVVPYHGHSLHNVPDRDDNLVLVRPARASQRYWANFKRDIAALEEMLNEPNVKESEIETLLRNNPLFLRGLNYKNVYPQVVLPTSDGHSLRPDAIAEPVDSEWAHVIDFKLPSEKVLVGKDNRATLANGIHSVVAQLREYSAFFDNRVAAKTVESRYGFKCYRPKLVAIVGRDPSTFDEEQRRRALTHYPDVEIVTYDKLLSVAKSKSMLLI